MATTKSSSNSTASKSSGGKAASGKSYEKSSRCWPGYEPVPGKAEHEQGSCKPKAASKNGGKQVDRETARKKQVSMGGKRAEQAKGKSPNAAERKTVSKAATAHRATKSAGKAGSSGSSGSKTKVSAPRAKASAGRKTASKRAS